MAEVGFFRRVAPAVGLAVAGGLLLYLLPSAGDADATAGGAIAVPKATTVPSARASGAAPKQRVVQGNAIDFKFGTVQVEVALDGTTITDIGTLTAPGGSYQSYTNVAIPEMKSKILAAQSTQVASASGATYTSEAYAQSVQSALNRA